MYIDPNFVNIIFVVSLILLAICFIVFLAFFIPVLIQVTKTLQAIQTIATLLKEYSLNFNEKLSEASEGFDKVKSLALNVLSSFVDMALSFLKKKS